jgi:2-dehydro-3-deoxyglucarate aldolase
MALKNSPSAPVVRPPAHDSASIKRFLDSGFANFLVPFVGSGDDAARDIAATRYPTQGIRGVSVSQHSNRYATVANYFDIADDSDNVRVIFKIEGREAVDNIDEILAVDGVDAVFVRPSDLASYGHIGNPNHPDVQ